MTTNQSKAHDKLVEVLVEELSLEYALVLSNVCYPSNTENVIGEVDAAGVNPGRVDFYEVKGSYHKSSLRKAIKQLRRMREFWKFPGQDYVVTPKNGRETLEEVVKKLKH